ncbi:MAG TPA: ABC transporter permease [Solirubrobacteraceae bacterium]|jgi:ABC-2 type transport system permease protein
MTSAPTPPIPTPIESLSARTWWSVRNALVLARRGVARIVREPSQLLDVTVQPIIFVLLFVYVFGSAIHLPGGGNYHEYLIGGMFGMALTGTAQGTAVGVSTDMAAGLIDRFRSLPIARSAVLTGRVLADLLTEVIAIVVLVITGLAVGWGIHHGVGDALAAFGLCLLIAFAMTWAGACAGMLVKNPEAAQAVGFIFFLPMVFISNTFVPTQGMPAWLRIVANWNPVSAVAASCRNLFGNPNPSAHIQAWPMQHPELATILWSIGLIAVFAPLAVHLYRRKSLQ